MKLREHLVTAPLEKVDEAIFGFESTVNYQAKRFRCCRGSLERQRMLLLSTPLVMVVGS